MDPEFGLHGRNRMKSTRLTILAAGCLLVAAAACAPYADVGLTTSQAAVSGCQKVGDVAAKDGTPNAEVHGELSDAARREGANFVLIASDDARSGAAYKCEGPRAR
jgi:hypothetical protein